MLTKQAGVHGQTEDGAVALVHNLPMHEEPGIRDVNTHVQQKRRRLHVPAVPHFEMDREVHEDMLTIAEVQVKGDVDSNINSRRAHSDTKKICKHFGMCIRCHEVTSLETTCKCGGEA